MQEITQPSAPLEEEVFRQEETNGIDPESEKKANPRVFSIPKEARNEIVLLSQRPIWEEKHISEFGALMTVSLEKMIRDTERLFWSFLIKIIPEIKDATQNLSFDKSSMSVIEVGKDGQPIGPTYAIPEEEQESSKMFFEEIESIYATINRHVGPVLTSIKKQSEKNYTTLMEAIQKYVPQTSTGSWAMDLGKMVVFEVFPEEKENTEAE